ncbi:MAG: DUF2065 family protein [Nitrospirae bacterium]|nr:DUF2065 family protein [Nitrospirota bacterium]
MSDLVLGLGFVLLFEGVPLFLSPVRYRRLLARLAQVPDAVLRGAGLAAMAAGLALLYGVR